MLIAEELLLIALDPEKGTVPLGTPEYLKVGLAGALLAELALINSIGIVDGRVAATGHAPEDPMLRAVVAALEANPGAKAKTAVRRLDRRVGGVRGQLVDRLVDDGIVGRVRRAWCLPTRHPILDRELHHSVLARVQDAARGAGPLEPRGAVLLALAGPCQLLRRIAPERSGRRHAKGRIRQATATAPFAPEVKKIIDELIASAATAAAVAGAAAGN